MSAETFTLMPGHARRPRRQVHHYAVSGWLSQPWKPALPDEMKAFVRAAQRAPGLDWYERAMLQQAWRDAEYDAREMIHLGLLHALPVPHELFTPLCELRQKARAA